MGHSTKGISFCQHCVVWVIQSPVVHLHVSLTSFPKAREPELTWDKQEHSLVKPGAQTANLLSCGQVKGRPYFQIFWIIISSINHIHYLDCKYGYCTLKLCLNNMSGMCFVCKVMRQYTLRNKGSKRVLPEGLRFYPKPVSFRRTIF